MLRDAFDRPLRDLRVSVTRRCNLQCFYCHNEGQGSRVVPVSSAHANEMTPQHIERIVRVAASLGVERVKFTGGEPLVRPDLEEIVRRTAKHGVEVSLTTNGMLLESRAVGLRLAGLTRVNVSLDTIDPAAFEEIRGGRIRPVLAGVRAAVAAGLRPVKLNAVVFNQTWPMVPQLIDYASTIEGLEVQLIQFMPEMAWMQAQAISLDEVRRWLESRSAETAVRRIHNRHRYRIGGAWVEVVDPVGNPSFCDACHRVRVTAEGKLKGCLNVTEGLKDTVGLGDAQIEAALRQVVAERRPFYTRSEPAPQSATA